MSAISLTRFAHARVGEDGSVVVPLRPPWTKWKCSILASFAKRGRLFCLRETRPQAEETEKPSELSKRCEKHILIQADDLRGLRDLRGARQRQNTFFLSVRARTENTSVKNDSV